MWTVGRHKCPFSNMRSEFHGSLVVQMLVDLGLPVYVEEFERPFLESTTEFYRVRHHFCFSACLVLRPRLCAYCLQLLEVTATCYRAYQSNGIMLAGLLSLLWP